MNKIKCLIVDDEPKARDILDLYIQDIPELQLIGQCKNAIEAINLMADKEVDLIFLDIEMPEISGIAFAKSLSKKTGIIFTTAFRDYAVEGFDLNAIDYLLKPIRPERFKEAIEKYKSISNRDTTIDSSAGNPTHLFVRSDRKMIKLSLPDIHFIESLSDYLKIHTSEGLVVTRETMTSLEEKLSKSQFLRIHRSYLINVNHITAYTKETVDIKGTELPISRSYRETVQQRLTAS